MNQVVSFERVIYFGYIQEVKKDPALIEQIQKDRRAGPRIAFGSRVKAPQALLPDVLLPGGAAASRASPQRRSADYEQQSHGALAGITPSLNRNRNSRGGGIPPFAPYDEHFDRVHSTIKKL